MGKHVPGSAQHTVIHDGLRYQFPSAKEADMFRQSPAQFVGAVATMGKTGMKQTKPSSAAAKAVRLVGRTGCAACEFGIKPLGSPDELGLAIETNDGKVIVVEEAHKLYPKQYKDRFEGNEIAVEGHVVKTQGNVTWLKPTTLTSIN
jgi:YHS domain-containing protein